MTPQGLDTQDHWPIAGVHMLEGATDPEQEE
jgi:hypothetical protein